MESGAQEKNQDAILRVICIWRFLEALGPEKVTWFQKSGTKPPRTSKRQVKPVIWEKEEVRVLSWKPQEEGILRWGEFEKDVGRELTVDFGKCLTTGDLGKSCFIRVQENVVRLFQIGLSLRCPTGGSVTLGMASCVPFGAGTNLYTLPCNLAISI